MTSPSPGRLLPGDDYAPTPHQLAAAATLPPGLAQLIEAHKIDNPRQRAFLAAYSREPFIAAACRAADVSHASYCHWARDPNFALAANLAKQVAIEALEAASLERARDGFTGEKHTYDGEGKLLQRETYRTPRDQLAMFMLKAHRPDVYGQVDTPKVATQVNVVVRYVQEPIPEQRVNEYSLTQDQSPTAE